MCLSAVPVDYNACRHCFHPAFLGYSDVLSVNQACVRVRLCVRVCVSVGPSVCCLDMTALVEWPLNTKLIIIIIHTFSIALFPAERAQRARSHTCTSYIPFTFTIIYKQSNNTYLINYTNIKQVLVK